MMKWRFLLFVAIVLSWFDAPAQAQSSDRLNQSLSMESVRERQVFDLLTTRYGVHVPEPSGCLEDCIRPALLLEADQNLDRQRSNCLFNAVVSLFPTVERGAITGVMLSATILAIDPASSEVWSRQSGILIPAPSGIGSGQMADAICAPEVVRHEGLNYALAPSLEANVPSRLYEWAFQGATVSAAYRSYDPIDRALDRHLQSRPLLQRLFGYRSEAVQLFIRSIPSGANVLIDGIDSGIVTDTLVAIAPRSFPNVVIRRGGLSQRLNHCRATSRTGPAQLAVSCQLVASRTRRAR